MRSYVSFLVHMTRQPLASATRVPPSIRLNAIGRRPWWRRRYFGIQTATLVVIVIVAAGQWINRSELIGLRQRFAAIEELTGMKNTQRGQQTASQQPQPKNQKFASSEVWKAELSCFQVVFFAIRESRH